VAAFQELAAGLARVDVLAALASLAVERRYCRPQIVEDRVLEIIDGKHPVLEQQLGSEFVANDCCFADGDSLALITGPNMAGKSTFIRQTALIVLLAHSGSFVPADRAEIGVTDRIFTRIGADDALHAGQSTFMVEMTETARILHHATARSLIILDEIGRGTSTLDGLSLAWAIAETLAGPESRARGRLKAGDSAISTPASPRTLFATHYHELTDLEERLPGRVKNLHVSVREWGDQIVFVHRILPGRTDQSYGIHVAKLAGIPAETIRRAREVLESLEVQHVSPAAPAARPASDSAARSGQLSLFTEYLAHPAIDALGAIDLDDISPNRAHEELRRLKALVSVPPTTPARGGQPDARVKDSASQSRSRTVSEPSVATAQAPLLTPQTRPTSPAPHPATPG
jgi:DNA mismatch repair protein MutS